MRISRLLLATALAFAIVLTGCAGLPAASRGASPAVTPTVLAVGEQTNGVAPNRAIDVQFSTDMDPATINASTFLVHQKGSRAMLPGVVTYDKSSRIASLKPNDEFLPLTSYSAVITTGAASSAGVHLLSDYTFSFTTRASTDSSPIAVLTTSPVDRSSCVTPSVITITFTEGADPATVNSNTIQVRSTVGLVSGTVTYNAATNTATFAPTSSLPAPVIEVTVDGVADLAGVAMTAPYMFSFNNAPCNGSIPPACSLNYATLDVSNAQSTTPNGINNAGQIVGWFSDQADNIHAFLDQNGTFTTLDAPWSQFGGTIATGISNSGVIVGHSPDSLPRVGFFYENGTWTSFSYQAPDVAGASTFPTGVNSSGVAVGTASYPTCCGGPLATVSWIRSADGTFTTVQDGPLPEGNRTAAGINDSGVIVGIAPGMSFSYANGTFTYFQVPGAAISSATGINNTGQIVGDFLYHPSANTEKVAGYVKTGDTYCTVAVPNAQLTNVNGINDGGGVVGTYVDAGQQNHGFVATPK